MLYRRLGTSDLLISEIGLGSLIFSGETAPDIAKSCIDVAFARGVNFFDTANMYGQGAAEAFLGETLARRCRHDYVLATKVFYPVEPGEPSGLSREQIGRQLEASLRRLRTDYIDLYQCHRFDENVPLEETMTALSEAVRSGKVRWLGFSEWPAEKIRMAVDMAGVEKFVASQPQYSMLWRQPEGEIFSACSRYGIGQLAYSPLTQGVLTGKYLPNQAPPEGSRATHPYMKDWIAGYMGEPIREAVLALSRLAQRHGISVSQLALAWILRQPNVACALVGASRPEHVADNAAASGIRIDLDVFAEADRITASVALS